MTVIFFPLIDLVLIVGLEAAAAAFRKAGGERLISNRAGHAALAAMFVVVGVSGCALAGGRPPPPESCPVASIGRELIALRWEVPALRSTKRE